MVMLRILLLFMLSMLGTPRKKAAGEVFPAPP